VSLLMTKVHFFSHTTSLTLSHIISSLEDVCLQSDEGDLYSKNTEDEPQYHEAFLSSMCDDCYDNVDQNQHDYSFLRLESCKCSDDSDIQYETLDFNVMSNVNNNFIDDSGMHYSQHTGSVEPTALVAQVSYDNGDDSTNWILDSGSTHHMNGFANDFLNMKLEGYDVGLLVKCI